MFTLDLFPARDGDCLVLSWGEADAPKRLLIDCGREGTWKALKDYALTLPEAQRVFELLVVTHIDADHIAGVLKMLRDPDRPISFREVWFNAYPHLLEGDIESFGPGQGEQLSDLLKPHAAVWNRRFDGKAVVVPDHDAPPRLAIEGLELTLLSPTPATLGNLAKEWKKWLQSEGLDEGLDVPPLPPTPPQIPPGFESFGGAPDVAALAAAPAKQDDEPPNGSSIAFAAEYEGVRILLTGDAHTGVLTAALAALPEPERRFQLVKLSHHGSRANIDATLVDLVGAQHFVISTDGSRHHHPDDETIALILAKTVGPKALHFNYRQDWVVQWSNPDLRASYGYATNYGEAGRLHLDLAALEPFLPA